jgi:hypothetical protein
MVEIGDEATQHWPGTRGVKRLLLSMGCEREAVRNVAAIRAASSAESSPIDAFLPLTSARSFKLMLSNQRTWGALAIRFLEIVN